MRDDEVQRMADLEDQHWWYRGLRRLVVSFLHAIVPSLATKQSSDSTLQILDAGAGTGGMLYAIEQSLRSSGRDVALTAVDSSELACRITRRRLERTSTHLGSVLSLPFDHSVFDIVLCLDVLGQDGVGVDAALEELHRVLVPSGAAIINVAAFDWMRSYHDEAVGQVRRFGRDEVADALSTAGFRIERISYWNCFLFPVMAIRRKVLPRRDAASDVQSTSRLTDLIGSWALSIEHGLIDRGMNLPFGGSVIVLARREV